MNKKKLILAGGAVGLVLVIIFIVLISKSFISKKETTETSFKNQAAISSGTLAINNDQSNVLANATSSTESKTVNISEVNRIFSEKVSGVTTDQLNSFSQIAAAGNMSECDNLPDQSSQCSYYFAIYHDSDGFCGDVTDASLQADCYKTLVLDGLAGRLAACQAQTTIDLKAECWHNIFWGIKKVSDCSFFQDQATSQACLDSFNLQTAMVKRTAVSCSDIQDQNLKNYCTDLLKPGDFDGDGLSDEKEQSIGTNPYKADTDGDGHNDKEEIASGYNPCGSGKLPDAAQLKKDCAIYYKK